MSLTIVNLDNTKSAIRTTGTTNRLTLGSDGSIVPNVVGTGADPLEMATMSHLDTFFPCLKGVSGWHKLPNGLIQQWGRIANGTPNTTLNKMTIAFPIAFPTVCYSIHAECATLTDNLNTNQAYWDSNWFVSLPLGYTNLSGCEIGLVPQNPDGFGHYVYWTAIGK